MNRTKKLLLQTMSLICCICAMTSCANDDYTDAIPANSKAILSINAKELCAATGAKDPELLTMIFGKNDLENSGLDFSKNIFIFESSDGNLGACIKISDMDKTSEWLEELKGKGICNKITEKRDFTFTIAKNSWAIAYNDKAMIIQGPVLPAQQADAIRAAGRYLKQDKDNSLRNAPIIEKLDSIGGPIGIVAQVDALPEKLAIPFTLGQPKEADASQIMIAASITPNRNGYLLIDGKTFSQDKQINEKLKKATDKFRKINGRYTGNIGGNSMCSIFMNVNGNDFASIAHNSSSLGALLAGANTAIDMDKIIKCINGEFAISIDGFEEDDIKMSMIAQLDNKSFLNDVDYWKKSCPGGTSIENCGKDFYRFKSDDAPFWFGVSKSDEFFASSSYDTAKSILMPSSSPMPHTITNIVKGKRLCMILNVSRMTTDNKEMSGVTNALKPLFGEVKAVIYSMK